MKYSTSILAAMLTSSSPLVMAAAIPVEETTSLYPSSLNCGKYDGALQGLAGVAPPDMGDLPKAASRLAKAGKTCTTPAGSGKCIRVACDNTTGIWVCNTDGHNGPYAPACTDVAAYVYRGEGDGDNVKDLYSTCRDSGLYSVTSVSGQAFDASGNWNVITGYANCNHPPTNPPNAE